MSGDFYRREIVTTGDGSSSVFLPDFDEHYHSHHGALRESEHVFIRMGLEQKAAETSETIRIFEMGFGTGLNAWLTLNWSMRTGRKLDYETIEAYPLAVDDALLLNYASLPGADAGSRKYFETIHQLSWNEKHQPAENFAFTKTETSLDRFDPSEKFDLVFYDAFAPRVQPELWTEEVFRKIASLMKPSGLLVTYCAKGEVKRNLRSSGFIVESLPGPPGKREMTRARKKEF